ncbi:protein of unknown function [Shewanella benthica]|uniref:Uncharacterized protein n=1 Tax=Shewanella benthica TaxID=43661 RepID=A0A330M1Z7_9GAMM|nr:protein of unknown function [Shewanella benthica]
MLAGIYFLEPKDKSWIPEQARDDIYTYAGSRNKSGKTRVI